MDGRSRSARSTSRRPRSGDCSASARIKSSSKQPSLISSCSRGERLCGSDPRLPGLDGARRGEDRQRSPRRRANRFRVVGNVQAREMGLVEQRFSPALAESSEPLLVPARDLLYVPSLSGLCEQVAGTPCQIVEIPLAADLGLDRGQGRLRITPALLRHEVLGLEQGPGEPGPQLGLAPGFPGGEFQPGGAQTERREQAERKQRGGQGMAARQLDPALPERCAAGGDRPAGEIILEVLGQRPGRAVAAGRLLVQALQADRLQVAGDPGHEPGGRHDLVFDDLADRLDRCFPLERRTAGEHLVKDRSQRIDVRGRADLPGCARGPARGPCSWASP